MLNKGEGFTDEFEMEVHIYSEKSSSKLKQQYKDWTSTMKKEGSAFFKSVKDKVCYNLGVRSCFYVIVRVLLWFVGQPSREDRCEISEYCLRDLEH